MKNPRSAPETNLGRRNKNRMIQRVTRQQRASVENRSFYQNGREWAVLHDDRAVEARRAAIRRELPDADFVPGIIHKGHPDNGLDAGKKCSC